MLNQMLEYLQNYFPVFSEVTGLISYQYEVDATFTTNGTIAGDFTSTFLAGEYILVEGTRLNDGVYKISTIADDEIVIDTTIDLEIETEAETEAVFTKVNIPRPLLSVLDDIVSYSSKTTEGIASEKQGDTSITYLSGGSGWHSAFEGRLSQYKKLRWR